MAETGSSKSASSVSESDSQPSGGSSSGASSSSEEHTCHRCGNYCYSDKSRLKLSLAIEGAWFQPSAAPDCETFPEAAAIAVADIEDLILTADLSHFPPVSGFLRWEFDDGNPTPTGPSDPPSLSVTAQWFCSSNTWTVTVQTWIWHDGAARRVNIHNVAPPTGCDGVFPNTAGNGCGLSGPVALRYDQLSGPTNLVGRGTMSMAVENNPCCRDPILDECFQHFNGDCRGDCDESASSSASSSEENPFP